MPGGREIAFLGLFQHAHDYSLVTSQNPARPGETLIGYLTGLPGTNPPVPTGEAAPSSPPAIVPQFTMRGVPGWDIYTIRLGNLDTNNPIEVTPSFLGLVPGLAGVFQVNFTVPLAWSGGSTWLNLTRDRWGGMFSGGRPIINSSAPVFLPITQ